MIQLDGFDVRCIKRNCIVLFALLEQILFAKAIIAIG
jgi:hypothetical protein